MPDGGLTWGSSAPGRRGPRRTSLEKPKKTGPAIVAVAAALLATSSIVAAVQSAASADINSDKSQIAQLQQRIAQDGDSIEKLVFAYDEAQAHEAAVEAQLAAAQAHLVADQKAQAKAAANLRDIAINNYMSGADENSALAEFEVGNAASLAAQQEYAQVAAGGLRNAIDAVAVDVEQTQATQAQLQVAQTQAQAAVTQLDSDRQAAQAALAKDNALLGQVQGNLQSLLAAAAAQRAAAEREEEESLAAAAATISTQPLNVSYSPGPGGYANPLRAISALSPERVDQGVDYSGYGPIFAIGNGVVLSTTNSGWPGGTFISYRLTNGPAGGLVVYAGEDIYPLVAVGQSVTAGTVIGTMYEGPDGIETGWADPSGDGVTMARDAGQFAGSNSTAFGANFSELLASLGAPPGILQNSPPTGDLPPGWPSW